MVWEICFINLIKTEAFYKKIFRKPVSRQGGSVKALGGFYLVFDSSLSFDFFTEEGI